MIDKWGDHIEENQRTSRWVTLAIATLGFISIAELGFDLHISDELQRTKRAFSGQMREAKQNNSQQVGALEQKLTQANAVITGFQSELGSLEKRLRLTESNLTRASESGTRVRQEDAEKLDQMDLEMRTQLSTKASTEDLKAVNGSVNSVKMDLEGTKKDVKTTRIELGGLIGRNHEEIEALRRLGQRNYVEFSIQGKNKPQIVGNIIVELRSVNTKKNRFTVVLTVDDISTEKKDRTINEPIIFYPRGSHQADEFVVNLVAKDTITGYLSVPIGRSSN